MKAFIVVESVFGNTRLIAEAIADGLRSVGAEALVISACEAPETVTCDLLALEAPTPSALMSSSRAWSG